MEAIQIHPLYLFFWLVLFYFDIIR